MAEGWFSELAALFKFGLMIETERLILKPYAHDFAKEFFARFQNDRAHLQDYFSKTLNFTKTLRETQTYFHSKIEDFYNNKNFYFGIFLKNSDELIGHISIRDIDWDVPKGELAYFIFSNFSGQRYAYEALSALRDWCITDKGFSRIFMKISPDNIASKKVAEFCNFEFEGLLKNDYRKGQKFLTDMLLYAFTAELV